MTNPSLENSQIISILNPLQSQQAIVVVWEKEFRAELGLFENLDGEWRLIQRMAANVGRNGMGKLKEGDQKSPTGIFPLGTAFGIAPKPDGSKYPYRVLSVEDYWVDDSRSQFYNTWVRYREGDWKDWQRAEWLWNETVCYKHAVVISYNVEREPGRGSAIFLHVWKDENSPTQGCTAVSEENMIRILKWLDVAKKPVIIQGTDQDIIQIENAQNHL